jgi:hypothetical protein
MTNHLYGQTVVNPQRAVKAAEKVVNRETRGIEESAWLLVAFRVRS